MRPFPEGEDIKAALRRLESAEFPTDQSVDYAETLVEVGVGPAAEEAVRTIVAALAPGVIETLVQKHVVQTPIPTHIGICDERRTPNLASRLSDRGFSVRSGWTVTWEGGPTLEGDTLCPLALLAVWLRRMREPRPPILSY